MASFWSAGVCVVTGLMGHAASGLDRLKQKIAAPKIMPASGRAMPWPAKRAALGAQTCTVAFAESADAIAMVPLPPAAILRARPGRESALGGPRFCGPNRKKGRELFDLVACRRPHRAECRPT